MSALYSVKTVNKEGKRWYIENLRFIIDGEVVLQCSPEILSTPEGQVKFLKELSELPGVIREFSKTKYPAVIEHAFGPTKQNPNFGKEETESLLKTLVDYSTINEETE